MAENMTTIRRELGAEEASRWDEMSLNNIMKEEFQKILGKEFIPREMDDALQDRIKEIGAKMLSRKWLLQKGKSSPDREVKIKSGVKIIQKMYKAPGGLIRAIFEVRDGCFSDVSFSGDFFCYPLNAVQILESMLKDSPTEDAPGILKKFYEYPSMEIAGITIDDWIQVLKD
jgi:lipoate-protein ligase A